MTPRVEHPVTHPARRGLLLLLGGVVMGSAVGLLTAPQAGARTRRQLIRKAEDVKDQASEVYTNLAESVAGLRRGVMRQLEAGKQYLNKQREGLRTGPPSLTHPVRRLIHTLWG